MTHAQIQSAIDATIKGQGNQVDAGGKLAEILSSLLGNSAETAEVDDFEEFDSTTAYSANDIVRKDGKLYKFNTAHQGAWTGTDVTATSVFAILNALIQQAGGGGKVFTPLTQWTVETISKANAATKYGLTDTVWADMIAGKYTAITCILSEGMKIAVSFLSSSGIQASGSFYESGQTPSGTMWLSIELDGDNYVITGYLG